LNFMEVFLVGVGLSMDAFAVSICKGLSTQKLNWKNIITVGIYFGLFQGIMPLIGFLLGANFENLIKNFDHWIAFILLFAIGFNMIKEARGEESCPVGGFDFKTMVPLAVATSIDALAVGVVYACTHGKGFPILNAVSVIGVTTLVLSCIGVKVGNVFGAKYKAGAEIFGGSVLIIMGLKILIEHLMGL